MRCAICGRKLTADKSMARGIGPVCFGKMKEEFTLNENRSKPNNCKVCGVPRFQIPEWTKLGLPCNNYCCFKGHCPYGGETSCPRERVYIKTDFYPLYKKKPKFCSFCGDQITTGSYRKYLYRTKITLECCGCQIKNKDWRNNNINIPETMSPKNLDVYIKNQEDV